ncbi:MAG TPA: outer membrane protein assembly factor BamE [Gammaproteobacteria bacterium]|nr:outer membrane protein assembly factor BamE [Gammaproteobacteria bacterium]
MLSKRVRVNFRMSKLLRITGILLALLLLASCIKTYKHDIQQGNIVDPDRLARLELGMSKNDVQALIGTSLLQDSFHPDRWDYYYSLRKARAKKTEQQLITLYFKDDKLSQIISDVTSRDKTPASETKTVVIEEKPAKGGIIQRSWDKVWK